MEYTGVILNRKAIAAYCLVVLPTVACLITGSEFWPFTYFPMYSQRAQVFEWPHVQVRQAGAQNWDDLIEDRCFAPFGYVRYHFSVLKFHRLQKAPTVAALQKSLAVAVAKNCGDRRWEALRIEIRRHNISAGSTPTIVTPEVPVAL